MAMLITLDKAAPVMPMITDKVAGEIEKVDFIVSTCITQGFNAEIRGENYHFSFDETDQSNFMQELARATATAAAGDAAKYQANWRGHVLGEGNARTGGVVTLALNIQEFQTLAMTGGTWKSMVLQKGWKIKDELSKCTTEEQLNGVRARFDLDALYLAARDGAIVPLDVTEEDEPPRPDDPNGTVVGEVIMPKLILAKTEIFGTPGTRLPLGLSFGKIRDEFKDLTFDLHIWARNVVIHNFGDNAPYGMYKKDEPGYGEGQRIKVKFEELKRIVAGMEVEITEEYGMMDISFSPEGMNGFATVNCYTRPITLKSRAEARAEVDAFNRTIPAKPQELVAVEVEHSKEHARITALMKKDFPELKEMDEEYYKKYDELFKPFAEAHPLPYGDMDYADEEGIPMRYWDMMFSCDDTNILSTDLKRLERYKELLPQRIELIKQKQEAAGK